MGEKTGVREKLARYAHALTGFVIVMKGVGKIEHHQNGVGAVLIAIGIGFALFSFFHEKISFIKRHEAVLLWIEAVVLALVAFSYFAEGKKALPSAYVLCCVIYIIVGFYRFYRPKHTHQ
jgi:predicted Na+-dependent transporter